VAAVAGAALSGALALLGSFRVVFLVASAILLASIPIWTAASLAYGRRRAGTRNAADALPTVGSVAAPAKPH
jgi:hypothetical protein